MKTTMDKSFFRRMMTDPGLPVPEPTKSYWQEAQKSNLANVRSKTLLPETDIVVIGSGITGCSVTHWLLAADDNVKVMVLEARTLCSGATGRNGGNIKATAVMDYFNLRKKHSHEIATKIVEFTLAHFASLVSSAKELDVKILEEGEIRQVETVMGIIDPARLDEAKEALEFFEKNWPEMRGIHKLYGQEDAQKMSHMKNILGALVSPAGTAWPYRLVVGFFRALLSKYGERLAIETQTPVLAVQSDRHMTHPYVIQTPRGNIRAKNVVHCTEGHVTHLLPRLRGMIWPRRGQMTVQTPGSTFPHRDGKQVWSLHFRKHFDYAMQNHNSGEIFIGGGDVAHENYSAHLVNPRDNEESIVAKSHLRGILPSVFGEEIAADEPPRVKASWTGIMGFSLDGFPLLGRLPTDALERVNQSQQGAEWVAAGFSGYGMVNSWLCGRAVAEMVLGNPIPDWLPEQFLISPQRLNALNNILESKMKLVDPFGSML